MDILIIGNGFDLAHGLKTTYKDFLDYCYKTYTQAIIRDKSNKETPYIKNFWIKHFITIQNKLGDTWIDLENEIYKVITQINKTDAMNNSGIVSNFLPKVLTVSKNNMEFNFYNITDYLMKPNYVPILGEEEYAIDIKNNGVDDGKYRVYIKTPKGFVNFLYDQLRDFTSIFESYLIENTKLKSSPYILDLSSNVAHKLINLNVISFNYTNTCEALYNGTLNNNCKYNIKTIYIHGKANPDNCNLVLGTHSFDRANNKNDKNLSMDFNIFQKHNQRHKYGTIEAYQDFLKEITNPQKIIEPTFHVIGHSLDKTDHKILRHIFNAKKNSIINIYYHDPAIQDKLIDNITEIIGEEEVMKRVRLIDQHKDKRSILIPCE